MGAEDSFEPQRIILRNQMEFSLPRFGLASFLSFPFGIETSSLCLSYHCILKDNVLHDFTGPQVEKNITPGLTDPESHP